MQLHKRSFDMLQKYVNVEKMLRDLVLLKLKIMETRTSLHKKLIERQQNLSTDAQM